MAADIIRESSFMQQLSDIKECDVGIKIIYCLDDPSTVNHFKYLNIFWTLSGNFGHDSRCHNLLTKNVKFQWIDLDL